MPRQGVEVEEGVVEVVDRDQGAINQYLNHDLVVGLARGLHECDLHPPEVERPAAREGVD